LLRKYYPKQFCMASEFPLNKTVFYAKDFAILDDKDSEACSFSRRPFVFESIAQAVQMSACTKTWVSSAFEP